MSTIADHPGVARAHVPTVVLRPFLAWWRTPASLRTGTGILVGLLLLAVVGAHFLPDPNEQNLAATYAHPGTAGHPLGADPLGRDVLAWICASIITLLELSAVVVLISASVGVSVGLLAGYLGGPLDALLMRFVDINLAIPGMLLFIAASAVVRPSMLSLILLLSVVFWVPYARLVRTKVQLERSRPSIAAARLAGVSRRRIYVAHLLPAVAGTVLVWASLNFGFVMLAEASLAFLGLGLQPPSTSLGYMISEGTQTIAQNWWIVAFPGVVLVLLLLAMNLIGEGLQDLFSIRLDRRGR
jgi:peptide/nickel transport system permease protein